MAAILYLRRCPESPVKMSRAKKAGNTEATARHTDQPIATQQNTSPLQVSDTLIDATPRIIVGTPISISVSVARIVLSKSRLISYATHQHLEVGLRFGLYH
jgi:hypothetical protein